MPPDGLVVNRMNWNDGGKSVPKLRSTEFTLNGVALNQSMVLDNGTPKGIRTILEERRLFHLLNGNKVLECKPCPKDPTNLFCCGRWLLGNQPDFLAQRSWLREVVENAGHSIIFFPKFHCELNFIEMVWGYMKAQLRAECSNDFSDLMQRIKRFLSGRDKLPLAVLKKFERRCFRFMHGYKLGMKGPLLDFAMKKYSSHRMFPSDTVIRQIDEAEYEEYKAAKLVKLENIYQLS